MPDDGTPGVEGQEPQGGTGTQSGEGRSQPTGDTGGQDSTLDFQEQIKKVRNATMKRIADVDEKLGAKIDQLIQLQLESRGQGGGQPSPPASDELNMEELNKLAQKNPLAAMAKMVEYQTRSVEDRLAQRFEQQQQQAKMTGARMKIEGHLASRYPDLADSSSDFFMATQEEYNRRLNDWGMDPPEKKTPLWYSLVEGAAAAVKDRMGTRQNLVNGRKTAQDISRDATNIPDGSGEGDGRRSSGPMITEEDIALGRKLGFKMDDPAVQKTFLENKGLVIQEGEEE